MNKANECTCPSGDGSLVHPCPAHPAVEQAGGDERDFQAEGAQEVPSPVSQEYDRHLISLLRKGEALPGHQEEAADEIERLRDWNDHLNNTVLPNILNPTFLMLMKGGERLLDLCTKDGEFIGVSLNDMKDVFDWMVTHARIAPDQAALAQPSHAPELAERGTQHRFSTTEQTCRHDFAGVWWNDNGETKTGRECRHCGFFVADVTKAQAEQAEAERPEVVAWRYGFSGGIVSDKACLDEWKSGGEYQSLMTVAQHERIVGELRAVIAQLRQHKNDYMDSGQETYRALQNEIREREAEIARLDGLVSGRTAERDAALAEVNRLRESKGDPSGSFDMCMRMMYERDENAKRLDAALARVAELERGKVYVEARQCDECQHGGINDSATGVAACHECDWTGPEPEEDRCPGCQRENCMAAACPQCGARYVLVASEEIAAPVAQAQQLHDLDKQCRDDVARALGLRPNQERGFAWSYLLASIKSCVKASGDSAQAQHSAGYAEARQCVNCRHIGINDAADYAACHDCRWTGPEPDEDKCPGCAGENCMAAACPECGGRYELVAEAKISTPAAQAGQMPQAWLDVQAERRRQITAEGWTPEHDDLYCAAELPRAAAAYILNGANDEAPAIWPFVAKWWKPRDARSNYVRAGALILAEIERLDRAAPGKEVGHE
ncbi:hypothetical protein [Pseudomonas aeruginosa]|uniref:hypothetical protein n=1 Tax=Pseudomonas aeruginosa TaxID=287 RepID=UPI000F51DC9E|nr:hypothetical protein [Pseudomonas aeruginosa]